MIENETTTAVGSLSEVLRHLADAFDASMPEPSGMSYHTYDGRPPIVGLVFAVEGAACVETWAAKYGSKRGSSQQPSAEGTQWLTTDGFELMGMTVQMSGHDPVEVTAQPTAEAVPCGFRICDQDAAEGDEYCTPHRNEHDSAMRGARAWDRAMGS